MTEIVLSAEQEGQIGALVQVYAADRERYQVFLNGLRDLVDTHPLADYIHSTKSRLKDPDHLRDKLRRKMRDSLAEKRDFIYTAENLFEKINDLAGLRILHLHTRQFEHIDKHLREALAESKMPLVDAFARVWDDETREYFKKLGLRVEPSPLMYTSVHYVVEANVRTKRTGEIQVRTLAEELWGEVDHTINYPHPSSKKTCREQILVLARATSTCTRLVDSIFDAHDN